MAIVKTKNLVETYRARARSKDINELTGRTGRPDLTKFVAEQLAAKIPVKPDSVIVDIGCGDGLFLQKAAEKGLNGYAGRLIGILPTAEEVARVRNHLLTGPSQSTTLISIELGLAEKTSLPDNFTDILVCNGVLHGAGQTIENVNQSLAEFSRISKVGSMLFIGEMPDTDELAGKNFGDSIIGWLFWVLKNQGLAQFWVRLKQTVPAFFSSEPFIISPKKMFYMPPGEFAGLLKQYGFEVVEYYKHKEIDTAGNTCDSATRWNYIAIKR